MTKSTPSRELLAAEARAAMETCAVWNARLTARRVTQFFQQRMEGSGLGVVQFGLIAQIAGAKDDSLGALAERAGLDPSTLSRNLQVLEREGLVEIAAGERDTRRRAVKITELGAERLRGALDAWREAQSSLATRVDLDAILRATKATEGLDA